MKLNKKDCAHMLATNESLDPYLQDKGPLRDFFRANEYLKVRTSIHPITWPPWPVCSFGVHMPYHAATNVR